MIISETRPAEDSHVTPAILAAALRHRYQLLIPVAIGIGAGFVGYSMAVPTYRSETVLVLDARRIQALSTEAVVSPLPQDSPALRSELDVIGSTSMARTVVKRLQQQGLEVKLPAADGDDAAEAERLTSDRAARLISNLSVTNDGRSYTIYIDYTDEDPRFSAAVADIFAQEYIDHQTESQRNETRRVADWLGGKLGSLRQRLQQSEAAAEDFRAKAGLTQANGMTAQAQRVAALQGELMDAGASLAGAQARLATARQLQKTGDIPALSEVLASPAIQALRMQVAEAERKLAVIRASGASKSDQIPLLTRDIEAGKAQIGEEVENVVDSLQSEISVADEKYKRIARTLDQAQKLLGDASLDQLKLDQLEREAAANRAVYESYLERYKQAIEQEGIVTPQARIISSAASNTWKVGPRLTNWLALGAAIGGGFGLLAVFISQMRERRFRSPRELSRLTGLPILGIIPRLARARIAGSGNDAFDSRSEYGRALSAVSAALKLGQGQRMGYVLAVVSPCKGDGKTTLVMGLARALSAAGRRVAVIDTDTRRPMLAKRFAARPGAFLQDILDSSKPNPQLFCKDPASSVCIVAARKFADNPERLLASDQFRALVTDLGKRFDLVLLDTEALETSSAALHVAGAADGTVLVAAAKAAEAGLVMTAVERLAGCGRRPLGIVVNRHGAQVGGATEPLHRLPEVVAQHPEPPAIRAAE